VYDAAELLPAGAAISGWAAAYLLGCSDLDGLGRDGSSREPVLIDLPPPVQMRRREGIGQIRSALADDDVVEVEGIAVTSPLRTAFDLARLSEGREAVVALDAVGRDLRVEVSDVAEYAEHRRRWKGVPQARWAVRLADARSRSKGETRLRLVWSIDAGLPTPEVNVTVTTTDGFLLGIVDLLDPEAGFVGEYDGGGHRELGRHTLDNAREEWLEGAGLTVVRATAIDVRQVARVRTVRRLQAGHARARSRDRRRDRWTWRR
jgi:hypothetical protein